MLSHFSSAEETEAKRGHGDVWASHGRGRAWLSFTVVASLQSHLSGDMCEYGGHCVAGNTKPRKISKEITLN